MNSILEGSAKILFPTGQVFYNPAQCVNRDLSILAIKTFLEHFNTKKTKAKVLEALAATGLRSIRYAKEIENISILSNDIDPNAVNIIKLNMLENKVEEIIETSCNDANFLMYSLINQKQFQNIIDLDPYGSASPFLEAAIQCVENGGLLCITCTDMAVLCASYPESCFSKYMSIPLKGEICHEMALRIVLSLVERIASKHKKFITPLLSCSIDFYVRLFVQVSHSPEISKQSSSKLSFVFRCPSCKFHKFLPLMRKNGNHFAPQALPESLCSICNNKLQMAGPIWTEKIHSDLFLSRLLETINSSSREVYLSLDRLIGMITVISEETQDPLYISLPEICHVLKTVQPPMDSIISQISKLGFTCSNSHCNPNVLKSNIPWDSFYGIMRAWIDKVNQPKKFPFSDTISKIDCDFSIDKSCIPASKRKNLKRFPENPKMWGPLARPKTHK
jgi:tRNA (guanine26-N2/guanine27-N2)-dimethyltransferase